MWSNFETTTFIDDLCAGSYSLSAIDENNCQAIFNLPVEQPDEFIADIQIVQDIPCFGDSAGILTVTSNGNPINFVWNDIPGADTLFDQPAGSYTVEVTNQDGCSDTTTLFLLQPLSPLTVQISVDQPIICG